MAGSAEIGSRDAERQGARIRKRREEREKRERREKILERAYRGRIARRGDGDVEN